MSEENSNNNRDKVIVELLYNSYPNWKSADTLTSEFGRMCRKVKSIKNARAMGQILRKFKLPHKLSVVQNIEEYVTICRYQTLYRLKVIDFKNLEVYDGKPTQSIMEDLSKY